MINIFFESQEPEYLEIDSDVKEVAVASFDNSAVVLVNEQKWVIPKGRIFFSKDRMSIYPLNAGDDVFISVPGLESLIKAKFLELLPSYAFAGNSQKFQDWFEIRDSEKHGEIKIKEESWILPLKIILRSL